MKFSKYILALVLIVFISCEETIIIDTGDLAERVIIEGLVTNRGEQAFVKLTRSRDFYAQGPADRITNADVEVTVNESETVIFFHNPDNDPDLIGYYYPIGGLTGEIGSTYSLSVRIGEELFEASETMEPVTSIDSLTTKFNEDEFEDPEIDGRYFEVLLNAEEPQDRDDQYLFKFYRNDTVLRDFPTDVYVAEDELLGGRIAELEIPGYFSIDDVALVEMYSLTQEAFIFYFDLNNLINGDGGMFSPPPADPRNNLSNNALGYFQVSAIESDTVVVYDPREDE